MRFLDLDISRKGIVNVKKEAAAKTEAQKKKNKDIRDNIFRTAIIRSRAKIETWQNATLTAESVISPNNTELIKVYKNIEIDLHLFALMQTIRLKVIANNFFIYNADATPNEDLTKLFKRKWFRKTQKHIVDSELYGFSLIQLLDVENGIFSDAQLVPREYVIQQKRGVKKMLANVRDLVSFDAPEFKDWLIACGEIDNLGLLHKAAPIVIKKKEVIAAWSEAAEIFGMPLRIGKTNIGDPDKRKNMEEMLDNMGSAAWGVFSEDDEIIFAETSKTDFYRIYKEFVEVANAELSKGLLLQTGTTDEKSFTGAANVHENTLKDLIEYYIGLVEEVTNEDIIPKCQRLGLLPQGVYFASDNEQKLSLKEMIEIVKELLKYKEIPNDWIKTTFNVEVEDKEVPDALTNIVDPNAKPSSVMKDIKNLYSGALKSCCDA